MKKSGRQLNAEIADALAHSSVDACNFDALFAKLERAIDAHPRLTRVALGGQPVTSNTPLDHVHDPVMKVRRGSYSVSIPVKLQGSRKKPSEITGRGETAEGAIDDLITGLDHWAQVME